MKKRILQPLLIILLFLIFSCGKTDVNKSYSLLIENRNTKAIGFYLANGGNYGTEYPDTLPPSKSNYITLRVDPNKIFYNNSDIAWDKVLQGLRKDTLTVFIFDSDTLSKYPMETIRQQYKILRRYDLSNDDLRKLNWTVPYSPTISMKNMKMYPPYP